MSKNTIIMNPGWDEACQCGPELKSQVEGAVVILNQGLEEVMRDFKRDINIIVTDIPYKQHKLQHIARAIADHSNYMDELLEVGCTQFVLRSSFIPQKVIDGKRTDVDPNTGENYNILFSTGYSFKLTLEDLDRVECLASPSTAAASD